ncbi:response regulator [Rhizobium sp. P32RR-XVIII]|uniref:response regulator n=1 Tax=Rhizobium sp. P32RR-XVIII TaxID=2726738 RepID=UPI0014568541|nr:response regulator [Rhizobium sp. P32RR-XVIII]NLS08241.1 response regulator [Rhizobium sp. P32RR-XVIII]
MAEDNSTAPHLLVVDDDPRIRSMLKRYFEGEGFRVSEAENGTQLRQQLRDKIDLILLDIGLPGEDGLTLAREIRASRQIAIIIVSGRADDVDRIVGLEIGADDYIAKPFNLREVLARVRSVLRRTQASVAVRPAQTLNAAGITRFDGWTLDHNRRELRTPAGKTITLTTGEFDLLAVFAKNPGRALTRDFLMDQTRGRSWEVFDRSIDAQVTRLRRKIEADDGDSALIKSIRGVGYLFTGRAEHL